MTQLCPSGDHIEICGRHKFYSALKKYDNRWAINFLDLALVVAGLVTSNERMCLVNLSFDRLHWSTKFNFFFVPRGKISNPDSTFNAEFKYVSSFSPSPTVFCDSQVKCEKMCTSIFTYFTGKQNLTFFLHTEENICS
jgi:hypothetical protein